MLYQLAEKDKKWNWNQLHTEAFEKLKDFLTNPPTLSYPRFNKPFLLICDASKFAIGCVSSQAHDGKECVISYGSKHCHLNSEIGFLYDREWWAVVWGIRHYRPYLAGAPFTIVTDHEPLVGKKNILPEHDPTGWRGRWQLSH